MYRLMGTSVITSLVTCYTFLVSERASRRRKASDDTCSSNFAYAIGLIQMQAIFGGSRLVSAHASKASHNIAESVLPFWSRQSSQVSSAFGASGSSVSAACLLARRCYKATTVQHCLNAQQGRSLAQVVFTSSKAGQQRGFAAQAVLRSGHRRFIAVKVSNTHCQIAHKCLCGSTCVSAVPELQHVLKRKQSTLAASLPKAASGVALVGVCTRVYSVQTNVSDCNLA